MVAPNQTKAERARNLRFKKGIAQGFNINEILDELMSISGECDDIRYIAEGDEDTLIAALDGDEEDAYEFRMMFSELSQECENLNDRLNEEYITEYFDEFFCRVAGGCMQILGYDSYEEDYYALTSYESELAQGESEKRLRFARPNRNSKHRSRCISTARKTETITSGPGRDIHTLMNAATTHLTKTEMARLSESLCAMR